MKYAYWCSVRLVTFFRKNHPVQSLSTEIFRLVGRFEMISRQIIDKFHGDPLTIQSVFRKRIVRQYVYAVDAQIQSDNNNLDAFMYFIIFDARYKILITFICSGHNRFLLAKSSRHSCTICMTCHCNMCISHVKVRKTLTCSDAKVQNRSLQPIYPPEQNVNTCMAAPPSP